MENYPGFPEGIQGPELVERMKQQAQRFGANYKMEVATEADLSKRPFKISTEKATYETESLIVASGASAAVAKVLNGWKPQRKASTLRLLRAGAAGAAAALLIDSGSLNT